jgi:zinc protease
MIDRKTAPVSPSFQPFAINQAQSYFLENGIPVHLLQSGNQPIVRLEFLFKAGSWFERKNGLSHLSTKMLKEGTSRLNAKEIAETIALYGAFVEVHQGFEHANLTFYLMEKHLANLLPIIAEMLTESVYPENELENLKTITIQGIKVNKEKSQFLATTEFRKTLFGLSHPYGRHYWEDDIQSISQEDVKDFAKQNFQLGNMEVFISGQFDSESALNMLEKYFESNSNLTPAIQYEGVEFQQKGSNKVLVERNDAMQSSIRYGCHSISRNHSDFVGLLVVNELLGGFFGSRLMKNIREDKGYTYGIHSSLHPMVHGAYYLIATDVKKENTQHTLDEIDKEISILNTELVAEDELQTVKSYMLGRFMNSINTPFSLMDKFKTLHFNGLAYDYYERYVKEVQNISPDSVLELSNQYLKTEKFTQVVVGGLQ